MNSLKTGLRNHINHVVLVLDKSSSMEPVADALVKVVDTLVAWLAVRSKEMDQETRVTVYTFGGNTDIGCLIYDMDVLRLPSIKEHYRPGGMTALIKAATRALTELAETPERYGDHAFLVYVLTDGDENDSYEEGQYGWLGTRMAPSGLLRRITALPEHWTVAALVPDACISPERERCVAYSGRCGIHAARQCGFPMSNIAVWDATNAEGVREVGKTIQRATDTFMQNRAKGVRGTTQLFDISAAALNADAVLAAGLTPVDYSEYKLIPIPPLPPKVSDEDWALAHPGKKRKPPLPWGGEIGNFVRKVNGGLYTAGDAYYQLAEGRRAIIQPNKTIVVLDTTTDRIYRGDGVRKMVGLDGGLTVKVKPSASDRFKLYVQSTSDNRHLVPGTRLLLFKA